MSSSCVSMYFVNNTKDKISNCTLCNNTCHSSCLSEPFFSCSKCIEQKLQLHSTNPGSAHNLNVLFDNVSFNPYNEISDNDKNRFFEDEIDDFCDTAECANRTLASCKYYDFNDPQLNKLLGTSFYFNNIDGFQSNFDEFKNLSLNKIDKFDFYCFNETNLKSGTNHDFTIDNYTPHYLYSIEGKPKGSGLAIYHRSNLKFTVNKTLTFRNKFFECLGGKLKTDIGNINVIVIYRFSSNSKISDGIDKLQDLLDSVSDQPSVVMGDLNTLKEEDDINVQKYIDAFMCHGFAPLINKPTHFKGKVCTSIDQIWCNMISENVTSGILSVSTSAHMPIFASIPSNPESMYHVDESSSNLIKIHNICSKSIEKFKSAISGINDKFASHFCINPNINSADCINQFNSYYSDVKNAYDECFLDTVDISSKRNFVDKPWISLGIAKSCEVKNNLHVEVIKARKRNDPNLEEINSVYKSYRTKLTAIKRKAQTDYFKKRFEKCQDDVK